MSRSLKRIAICPLNQRAIVFLHLHLACNDYFEGHPVSLWGSISPEGDLIPSLSQHKENLNMREFVGLWFLYLFWMSTSVIKCDDNINSFITDVISKFRLKSPTIVYHGSAPEICFTNQWVLCLNLENEQNIIQKGKGNANTTKLQN